MPFNQVTAKRRQSDKSPSPGAIDALRASFAIVLEECRPRVFARTQKDRVGMLQSLFRKGGDMQSAEGNVRAFFAIVVRDSVGAPCRSDVNLNNNEIRLVVQFEFLDMFVLQVDGGV